MSDEVRSEGRVRRILDDRQKLAPGAKRAGPSWWAPGAKRAGPSWWVPIASWSIGTLLVTVFFAIGAWQRRWIADDGLIVLRTIKNLYAGNGPVFNAGERVEANTSTAWTYLLAFWGWVTGAQLEYVALWVALICSVAAIPIAMYGTARLYAGRWRNGLMLLLPLGSVLYISLPPARDFATSGLENGMVILWIAILWVLFLAWARRDPARTDLKARAAFLFLAFWAGLAPLVRPEITVLGALVLLVLFASRIGWWTRIAMVVLAGALPIGYQVFRMGYYAILVPNPAIAKDASGSKWGQGFTYLTNLFGPYLVLIPVILAILVGGVVLATRNRAGTEDAPEPAKPAAGRHAAVDTEDPATERLGVPDILERAGARRRAHEVDAAEPEAGKSAAVPEPATAASGAEPTVASRWAAFQDCLHTPSAVVATVVLAGLILTLYWIRQGGDFMHGRVLLAPLFIVLLPVMVVPAVLPETARSRVGRLQLAGAVFTLLASLGTVVWGTVVHGKVISASPMDISRDGIVDERRFYVANMANENPVTAEDYLDYPRMRAMMETIEERKDTGGILFGSFDYDYWTAADLRAEGLPPEQQGKTTVYFLNLGMTGMNAPLDVRVVDQMGLAYPLAAHTERLKDGRIGHDKNLPYAWVIAESGGVNGGPGKPGFIKTEDVRNANLALTCQETQDRFASYKDTWSFSRFRHNLRQSVDFNGYRIARQPEYEVLRCGLSPADK